MTLNKTNLILRSSDEWDMPAGQVDVSFPLLRDGLYKMIIRSPEWKRNSKDTADNLSMKLEITEEARDTEGNKLHAGFKFTHRINGASGERDERAVIKDIAALLQAVEGKESKTTPKQLKENAGIIGDKLVWAKVSTQPAKGEFAASNKATLIPPDKAAKK